MLKVVRSLADWFFRTVTVTDEVMVYGNVDSVTLN